MAKTMKVNLAGREVDIVRLVLAFIGLGAAGFLWAFNAGYVTFLSTLTQTNVQYVVGVLGLVWVIPELWIFRKFDGFFNILAGAIAMVCAAILALTWEGALLSIYYIYVYVGLMIITVIAEVFGE